jgi:glycosyltransferase involved in cell wall biosynthesis
MAAQVQILLSVYNGEKYLTEQIQSIINQTHQNWELLIKNDGSTDGSLSIINAFIKNHPSRIKLVSTLVGGSATRSFMSMLPLVDAPYAMFCDQDDVWLPQKIDKSVKAIQKLEMMSPIALVYSDMEVVDTSLKTIYPSFLKQHQLNPNWSKQAYYVMAQSLAAGCTMVFTKKLIDELKPINDLLFQHDHWILIHAAYYGQIGFINENTLKYRQHDQNLVGAHGISIKYFIQKIRSLGLIVKRWFHLHRHLKPKPNIFRIAWAKFSLSLMRITGASKF